jgi:hypothetical protein
VTKLLLSVHVLAAILLVGPIAVAASLFPGYTRPGADARDLGIAAFLHRTCRGYAVAGVAVPVFGLATGAQLGVLTDSWLIASIALTAIAATMLCLGILPGQRRLLVPSARAASRGQPPSTAARLTAWTGAFNLVWAIVVVLMIVRPGSTTGA